MRPCTYQIATSARIWFATGSVCTDFRAPSPVLFSAISSWFSPPATIDAGGRGWLLLVSEERRLTMTPWRKQSSRQRAISRRRSMSKAGASSVVSKRKGACTGIGTGAPDWWQRVKSMHAAHISSPGSRSLTCDSPYELAPTAKIRQIAEVLD